MVHFLRCPLFTGASPSPLVKASDGTPGAPVTPCKTPAHKTILTHMQRVGRWNPATQGGPVKDEKRVPVSA